MALTVPWVLIAYSDIKSYMVQDQKDVIERINNEGQEDPFGAVMPDVVAEVRTAIASNPANSLSAVVLKVPPELKRTTIWLIIESLGVQFSNGAPLTPIQTEQVKQAHETLERVGNWKLEQRTMNGSTFNISMPDDPAPSPQDIRPTMAAVDTSGDEPPRTRLFTSKTMLGL